MVRTLIGLLVVGLLACDGEGMPAGGQDAGDVIDTTPTTVEVDARPGVDADDRPCTRWGRVSVCPDGTIGCDAMICISREPQACPPGPWPCDAE